jgi:hypothetical protein
MPPPSPFIEPISSASTYPSFPGFHIPLPQQYLPPVPPPPSLRTFSWSAPSSPQIHPVPGICDQIVAPSLTLESTWNLQKHPAPPFIQKSCLGSLVLWEPGNPATMYPFNLHSNDLRGHAKQPWSVTLSKCPGSLRLHSDSCSTICNTSQPCCQPCAEIMSTAKYRQVEDCAKSECRHRAYNMLTWEQMMARMREKSDLLAKEQSKV